MGNTTSVAQRSQGQTQSRSIPKASEVFAQQNDTDASEINSKSSNSGNNSKAPSLNGSISKATSQTVQTLVSSPSPNYQNDSFSKNSLPRTLSNVTITVNEDDHDFRNERPNKVGFQNEAEPIPIPSPSNKKRNSAKIKSVKMSKKEQQDFLMQLKKAAEAQSSDPETPTPSLPDKGQVARTLSFSNEISGSPDDDLRVNPNDVDHLKNMLAQKANGPPAASPSGSLKEKKSVKSFTTRIKAKPVPTTSSTSRSENLVQQLREQMSVLMEENAQKDHQMESMKNALIEKDQVIAEFTEKMMQIKTNIQTFTQQKNKQVQELQRQLKSVEKRHQAAMAENEQAEDEMQREMEELNERLFKTERENEQLSSEVDYWRQHALSFKKRLEVLQREADSDTHSDNGSYHRSNSARSLSMSESDEQNNNGSPVRSSHIEDQLDLENFVAILRQKEQAITDLEYELHTTRRKLSISEESAASLQYPEVEVIKKEYFFALAVGLKLGYMNNNKGVPNLDIERLWERAVLERVDRRLWKKWLQTKMDEVTQGKSYSSTPTGFAFAQPN